MARQYLSTTVIVLVCVVYIVQGYPRCRYPFRRWSCQHDGGRCNGEYVSGFCPGSANIRCCVANGRSRCTDKSGRCQKNNLRCTGNYVTGLCPGPSNIRCCVPKGPTTGNACSKVTIVSRKQWGARSAGMAYIKNGLKFVFIHHTVTPSCSNRASCAVRVRGIQNYHMNTRKWSDIGYSFLIGGDGNVYEGRGWNKRGAHTFGYNAKSYGIAFIGNFNTRLPNTKMLTAAKNLMACGERLGKISRNYRLMGHRDVGNTKCPGNKLYAEIKKWPQYK